jgi:hypothetical protein
MECGLAINCPGDLSDLTAKLSKTNIHDVKNHHHSMVAQTGWDVEKVLLLTVTSYRPKIDVAP